VDVVQSAIVACINSRINVSTTRYSGLVMLDRILSGCSKNIFLKYALLWINKSIELLEDVHTVIQEIPLACKVLGFLLEYCKKIPELYKQISMQNIRQLILVVDTLLNNEECGAIYYLIAVMLYHYPEVCERSQELIKKMIMKQIDSRQEHLINSSAKCYILLSKATERSFKPPATKSMYTRWTYNQALLCNNLHAIMDELFSELIELKTVDIWDKLDVSPISEKNVIQYYNDQKQRFFNFCIYLSSMLNGYDTKNSVVPHDILEVLCRGLAITPLNLKDKTSFKEQMLYIILPKLHIGLLTVLNALISRFAQELIPFGKIILSLFQQMLQWTSTVLENHLTFSSNKSFKNVRISIYKCLSSWLINTYSLSGIETIANECFTFIMKDITPKRDRVLLITQKSQHWSKRVIKRFKDSQYENSAILNKENSVAENESLDVDLCQEALITLQNMIHSGGILLKQAFYKVRLFF
ncbi:proline-, glutamic acid- and leucine-rich protein 1-like, partial [Odontomachus brunneus]|uniref:proline-, glutamic acid- and leucine-rich protein 1-like n=1 Tax=Odontomachus brunneus TaxID=486640 RepID=UPI0013F25BD9